MLNRF